MAKPRIIESQETKGEFKLVGNVQGTSKDKFFVKGKTKTDVPQISMHIGTKVNAEGGSMYLDLRKQESDIYFYKKPEAKGQKGISKAIKFNKRKSFKEEGFLPIGLKIGIEQYIDEKGQVKNKNNNYSEWDGIEYLKDNLKEGMSIFSRGKVEFSSYKNSEGDLKKIIKFVPSQINRLTKEIDMTKEDYEATHDFIQTIVFKGISKDDSDKNDVKYIVEALVIGYSSIENVDFTLRNGSLAKTFRNNLEPYTAIQVFGKVNFKAEVEEEDDDPWNTKENSFNKGFKNFTTEMLILGANPETIDTDTYSESQIEADIEAIKASKKAKENFGEKQDNDKDNWGESMQNNSNDEIDDSWD